jgi:hypothetical protein
MGTIATRGVRALFARAKCDFSRFFGDQAHWQEARFDVRAVADRLILGTAARAPPNFLACLDFHDASSATSDQRPIQIIIFRRHLAPIDRHRPTLESNDQLLDRGVARERTKTQPRPPWAPNLSKWTVTGTLVRYCYPRKQVTAITGLKTSALLPTLPSEVQEHSMAEETTMIASALGAEHGVQRRTGRVMLAVLCGEITGRVFTLTGRESVIGRGDTAEVCVPGGDISRKHAKVILDVDGIAKIIDLKSTNGSFVNSRRVEVEVLREGDRVRIGKTTTVDVRYEYFENAANQSPGKADPKLGAGLAKPGDPSKPLAAGKRDYQQILTAFQHTLTIRKHRLGEHHPSVAAILDDIGNVMAEQGLYDDALDYYLQALSIYEDTNADTPVPEMAHTLVHVGEAKLGKKQPRHAVSPLTRAIQLLEERAAGPTELAPARFALARAMHGVGESAAKVVELGTNAREGFAAGDKRARAMVVDVEMWMSKEVGISLSGDAAARRAGRL